MTTLIRVIGVLALATSLDTALYDGFYTRSAYRMFHDMAVGFGFG